MFLKAATAYSFVLKDRGVEWNSTEDTSSDNISRNIRANQWVGLSVFNPSVSCVRVELYWYRGLECPCYIPGIVKRIVQYCRSAHNGNKTKNVEDGETVTGAGKFHVKQPCRLS